MYLLKIVNKKDNKVINSYQIDSLSNVKKIMAGTKTAVEAINKDIDIIIEQDSDFTTNNVIRRIIHSVMSSVR